MTGTCEARSFMLTALIYNSIYAAYSCRNKSKAAYQLFALCIFESYIENQGSSSKMEVVSKFRILYPLRRFRSTSLVPHLQAGKENLL